MNPFSGSCECLSKTSAPTALKGAAGEAETARMVSRYCDESRRSRSRRLSPVLNACRGDLSSPRAPTGACYEIHHADAFTWPAERAENFIHAIVTDPPYGLKEYTAAEQAKMRAGKGGVWRTPPSFDDAKRMGLPRFTDLNDSDIAALRRFFETFTRLALRVLVPGGHVMIATNPLLSQYVYGPMMEAGFEKRGEIIRLVQTLRGGDGPKNAHEEFPDVSVMPRSTWEPWGLFRKPIEGRVQDNLRKWAGGLRRVSSDKPFMDHFVVADPRRRTSDCAAPVPEAAGVHAAAGDRCPAFCKDVILDPFKGGGSTIAAAQAAGNVSALPRSQKQPRDRSEALRASNPAPGRFDMCIERPNTFGVHRSIRREGFSLNGPDNAPAHPDNGVSQKRPSATLLCHAAERVKGNTTYMRFKPGSAYDAGTLIHDVSCMSKGQSAGDRCGDDAQFPRDRAASPAELPTRSCTLIRRPARYLAILGAVPKRVDSDSNRDGSLRT